MNTIISPDQTECIDILSVTKQASFTFKADTKRQPLYINFTNAKIDGLSTLASPIGIDDYEEITLNVSNFLNFTNSTIVNPSQRFTIIGKNITLGQGSTVRYHSTLEIHATESLVLDGVIRQNDIIGSKATGLKDSFVKIY